LFAFCGHNKPRHLVEQRHITLHGFVKLLLEKFHFRSNGRSDFFYGIGHKMSGKEGYLKMMTNIIKIKSAEDFLRIKATQMPSNLSQFFMRYKIQPRFHLSHRMPEFFAGNIKSVVISRNTFNLPQGD